MYTQKVEFIVHIPIEEIEARAANFNLRHYYRSGVRRALFDWIKNKGIKRYDPTVTFESYCMITPQKEEIITGRIYFEIN